MTTIHFIGKQQDGNGHTVYHLTIDGEVYQYNQATDIFTNPKNGRTIRRHYLAANILKAFYQAWDPDAFAAAMETVNEYGIPDASEDPTSPLYCPAKPTGEPMELREDHVTTVDLTALIAHAKAATR